jgi:hypothetical protein
MKMLLIGIKQLTAVFEATVQAVEEAIINAIGSCRDDGRD